MKEKIPSKKIIALAIVSVGTISAVLVGKFLPEDALAFLKDSTASVSQSEIAYAPKESEEKSLDELDTDKDGLRDWEELLWGTDTENADTDRDKTPDGEEIKMGRDPLKPGPNDFLAEYNGDAGVKGLKADGTPITPEKTNLNASDVFSQQLFSKYLSLKNAGLDEDPESTVGVVNNLTDQAFSSFSFIQYNRSGLKTFDATVKEDLKFYASSFALLQLDFLKKVQTANASVKTDGDLMRLAEVYADYAQTLYEMKVPGQISTEHLTIVNNMSVASSVFNAVAKYKEDPIPAISALKAYKTTELSQAETFPKIAEYLRKNDIIFSDGVEANFWNNL